MLSQRCRKETDLIASYADIAVVCWLKFWKIIDEENIFKRVLEFDPAIGELYAACEQWVERDD